MGGPPRGFVAQAGSHAHHTGIRLTGNPANRVLRDSRRGAKAAIEWREHAPMREEKKI
jgi:hypothetical protein